MVDRISYIRRIGCYIEGMSGYDILGQLIDSPLVWTKRACIWGINWPLLLYRSMANLRDYGVQRTRNILGSVLV